MWLWKREGLTGKHCRAKHPRIPHSSSVRRRCREGKAGSSRDAVSADEPGRGSRSAATGTVLAKHKQRSVPAVLLTFKVPCGRNAWLPVTLQLPQAFPLPFCLASESWCGAGSGSSVQRRDRQSTTGVCGLCPLTLHSNHPPRQGGQNPPRGATKCRWKTGKVWDYVTPNAKHAIIQCTQELQSNWK